MLKTWVFRASRWTQQPRQLTKPISIILQNKLLFAITTLRELILPALILICQLEKLLDNFINKCFFVSLKDLLTTCHQLLSERHKAFMSTTGTGVPPRQSVAILLQTGFSPSVLWCWFAEDKWHFLSSKVSTAATTNWTRFFHYYVRHVYLSYASLMAWTLTASIPSSLLSKCQPQPSPYKASNGLFLSHQAL